MGHDHQALQAGVREAGLHGLGDLLVRGGDAPLLGPIDGLQEGLDGVGVLGELLRRHHVGRVGDAAGLQAHVGHDVPLARVLHLGGRGLEQGHVIPGAALEGWAHHIELDAVHHFQVLPGDQAVLPEHVAQGHEGHAPLAAADDGLALQAFPGEAGLVDPGHQKRPVPLGQLAHHHRVLLLPGVVHVHRRLRSGEAHVRVPGQ